MASRRLAFSDPEVIDLAAREFIPVAENCSYLQWQKDAKGEFFRLIAEQGHYAGRTQPSATRQGIYACTAEGRFLASINARQAEPMLGMMREALSRWHDEPHGAGDPFPLESYEPDPRLPRSAPANLLALNVFARDLPRAEETRPEDWRRDAVNHDHAWLTREEAESLLPDEPSVGRRYPVPPEIVRRLARFHLLDNVRGETPMWKDDEIRHAEMTLEGMEASPERVRLRLEGAVRNEARGMWAIRPFAERLPDAERGFDCRVRGFLDYDRAQRRFTRLDLLAVGMRWGGSEHNVRWDDPGPAPMGIAFELAGSLPRDRVLPQGSHSDYWGTRGR